MSDDSAGLPPALAGHRSLDPAGNLASNSEQLDYVVEQPASQWLDFVRKLRNLTGTLETRYFSQHMLDDIESKYGNNRERCRRAVLKWQNASSDHSIKELCCALRDSSHGLVADTLERSCNYPEDRQRVCAALQTDKHGRTLRISSCDVKKDDLIGRSSSTSCVYSGTWGSARVAVKTVPESAQECRDEKMLTKQLDRLRGEFKTHAKLQHPHVVTIFGWAASEQDASIVMELLEMTLRQRLAQSALLVADQVDLLLDVSNAVCYLHGLGITHCNLKSKNILLAINLAAGRYVAKVCDYAMAKDFSISDSSDVSAWRESFEDEASRDVYCLGVLGLEIAAGSRDLCGQRHERSRHAKAMSQLHGHILHSSLALCLTTDTSRRGKAAMIRKELLAARRSSDYESSCRQRQPALTPAASNALAAASVRPIVEKADLWSHLASVKSRLEWRALHTSPVQPDDCREIPSIVELDGRLVVSYNVKPKGVRIYSTTDLENWMPVPVPPEMNYCYGLCTVENQLYALVKPIGSNLCRLVRIGGESGEDFSLKCPIEQCWPTICSITNDRIMFIGGYEIAHAVDKSDVSRYRNIATITEVSIAAKSWTVCHGNPAPVSMAALRPAHCDGRAFLLGGFDHRVNPDTVLIHELVHGVEGCTVIPHQEAVTKSQVGATGHNGLIFVGGGRVKRGKFKASNSCYCMDPSSYERVSLPPLPEPRSCPAMIVFGNKLISIGGQDQNRTRYCNIHVLDLLLDGRS